MKLAIMQPYLFPYIGYFQLVNSVDKFIFYDDVNYIKGGWINRNCILINDERKYFTLNLIKPSSNKLINEITIGQNKDKILKTIKQNYSKSPFFNKIFPEIEMIFNTVNSNSKISKIAGLSIKRISNYLNLDVKFEYSSEIYPETKGMESVERLIEICKKNNAKIYINAIGGKDLYCKETFSDRGIELKFLKPGITEYKQFKKSFESGLSIIDVLMFNSPELIKKMLNNFIWLK